MFYQVEFSSKLSLPNLEAKLWWYFSKFGGLVSISIKSFESHHTTSLHANRRPWREQSRAHTMSAVSSNIALWLFLLVFMLELLLRPWDINPDFSFHPHPWTAKCSDIVSCSFSASTVSMRMSACPSPCLTGVSQELRRPTTWSAQGQRMASIISSC